jgi:type IV secretory pathway TrbF-like protein
VSSTFQEAMAAITTSAYNGRQRQLQDMEQAIAEAKDRMARKDRRDATLLWAVLILTCALTGSVVGNIYQGVNGVHEEVYVALVDHVGNVAPLVRLKDLPVTPEQGQVMGTLTHWVQTVRAISSDAVFMGTMWDWVKDFTSNTAIAMLADYRAEQKERQQRGRRVQLSLPQVQYLSGSRSYHVEWDECTVSAEGKLVLEESGYWKATLTVADFQSKAVIEARQLRLKKKNLRNFLGIMVDDIKWDVQRYPTPMAAEGRCVVR